MSAVYYNTVICTDKEANCDSLLDRWGSNLVKPYRGRTYLVHSDRSIQREDFERKGDLNCLQSLKVNFGVFLKKIAAFFNQQIADKYKIVNDFEQDAESTANTKISSRLPDGGGAETVGLIMMPLICCIACTGLCCSAGSGGGGGGGGD